MRDSGLGEVSDLEVDGWLRDTGGAPFAVRALAGDPAALPSPPEPVATEDLRAGALAGTRSPLDRVRTKQRVMTFHALGEMVSTDEDRVKVEDGLDALVSGDGVSNAPALRLWRQRLFFEAPGQLGGADVAARRLIEYRHLPGLIALARKAAAGSDVIIEVTQLVQGLNVLVTGFSSPDEGLIVPDPAFLFSRDPGSFRPARPSLVHSLVDRERLAVATPDSGLVEDVLDVDHIDVDLVVDGDPLLSLRDPASHVRGYPRSRRVPGTGRPRRSRDERPARLLRAARHQRQARRRPAGRQPRLSPARAGPHHPASPARNE